MKPMNSSHASAALEIRHLRLVRAVAAEGSVTRAARQLHLTQSAVSHQLVDLERALGTRLFDRVSRKMVLTSAGARLLAGSERVLRDLTTLERDLRSMGEDARVPLRVTTGCYTAYRWLPGVLGRFSDAFPRVDVTIVLEATRRVPEAFAADEVDFAITAEPPRDDALEITPLVKSDVVVVGRPDHPAFGGSERGVTWSALRGTRILVPDLSAYLSNRIDRAIRGDDPHAPPVRFQFIPLTEALLDLAQAGAGVALMDAWVVEPLVARAGKKALVARPLIPAVVRPFCAVYRRSNPRHLPLAELARAVQKESRAKVKSR